MCDHHVEYLTTEGKFIVLKDINIAVTYNKRMQPITITIPKGFKTNLATGLGSHINKKFKDPVKLAFIVHDYLYTYKIFDRKQADNILYDMLKDHVPYLFAKGVKLACRVFGRIFW